MVPSPFNTLLDTLPNGLHDAEVSSLHFDPVKRELKLRLRVWVGDVGAETEAERERYQSGVLVFRGVHYVVNTAPDPSYPYAKPSPLTIDADDLRDLREPPDVSLPPTPEGAFAVSIFVSEWNAFIYVAAREVVMTWRPRPPGAGAQIAARDPAPPTPAPPAPDPVSSAWLGYVGAGLMFIVGLPILVVLSPILLGYGLKEGLRYLRLVHRLKKAWPPGTFILVAYSEHATWGAYVRERLIPRLGPHCVVVNRSRGDWMAKFPLEAEALGYWGGKRAYNPLVIVLTPRWRARVFRLYDAFKRHDRGDSKTLEAEVERIVGCVEGIHQHRPGGGVDGSGTMR